MTRRVTISIFLLLVCGGSVPAAEQPTPQPVLNIPRVTRPPKLSDFLTNVPREAELVVTDFRQYMPGDGTPPSAPTTAYLSYDDANIYVAWVAKDDPKLIRARVAKRELIMTDDRFSLCIDTFHDHRHMYWFDINPYGVQADGNVTDGVEDDPSWDTLWHAESRITSDGYVGLAAIPFKSIRFPADKEQTWGVILGRWIMRNNEYALWPEVSRKRPGFVQQGGDMTGLHDISPGRNLQFIPYAAFSHAQFLDFMRLPTPGFVTDNRFRAGLDAKTVIRDALTLDVTVNPDFSQVESDDPQVTVNQRFEVVYPEKRPFFMENGGYFKTPMQLFFSRRIVDPQFGARLTGKFGKWALGALATDDRAPGLRVAEVDPLHERHTVTGVFRLQREFKGNSNLAVMATSEDFAGSHNRVLAMDTRLQVLPNWIFTGQAANSDTRALDGKRYNAPAYYADWAHSGKHFVSDTRYTDVGPEFRADLGFIRRTDIRETRNQTGYLWRPEGSVVQAYGPLLGTLINYDRQGRLQDWMVEPVFRLNLTRTTTLEPSHAEIYELYQGQGFRRHLNNIAFSSDWQKWLAIKANWNSGLGINYYPAAGQAPFLGASRDVSLGFTFRPGVHTRIDETYLYSTLHTRAGESVFNNHILRTKVNYQFNREYSLRFIADYNSVLPNPALVNLEKAKHVGFDVLFTWMLNPGTALYVGYTDLYDNWKLNPAMSPALARSTFPDLNTGRQVFVKLSYLLRY